MTDSNKWRVMVVDDDAPLLDTLLKALQDEYEAVGAVNGLDALEKIERYEPDLIILDVSMPCVDGIDTCRAIRKNVRFGEVPVIFLSGQDESTYFDRAGGLGAIRFLRKPIQPVDLLASCREVIRHLGVPAPPRKQYSTTDLETLDVDETGDQPISPIDATLAYEPDQAPEAAGPAPARTYASQTPARIMIIDDDGDVIAFMLAILRDHFEVFGVRDPVSAIYKIIRYQPDLIILDVAMPRMSGYQLSQLLRLNRTLRQIKVLFASSKDAPNEIAYAKKLGAADYQVKPFGAEELLSKVNAIVDAPDFIVREKALSFNEIRQAESTDPSPSQFL